MDPTVYVYLEQGVDGIFLDHAQDLHVLRVRVVGDFSHDCPRFFDPDAYCTGNGRDDCNVTSALESTFEMWAYEEEMFFLK